MSIRSKCMSLLAAMVITACGGDPGSTPSGLTTSGTGSSSGGGSSANTAAGSCAPNGTISTTQCTATCPAPMTGMAVCTNGAWGACMCMPAAAAVCGNGKIEGAEMCDGAALGATTSCSQLSPGYTGVLRCDATCKYDMTMCATGTPSNNGGSGSEGGAGG